VSLYAIGDLHLSLTADKSMEVFPGWENYVERIRAGFAGLSDGDVTVLAGDSSWGLDLDEALADLKFIDALPGKKVLLKGNHDYWWGTVGKMTAFLREHGLESIGFLHNNCVLYGDVALCGTRGWWYEDDFDDRHDEKVFRREVGRLRTSLEAAGDREKLVFLHYPPRYKNYEVPEILDLFREFGVKQCYYGHLHGYSHTLALEGEHEGVEYRLISGDYLGFRPRLIRAGDGHPDTNL